MNSKNISENFVDPNLIAEAYEATVEQLEFLPYLLQDIWSLGTDTNQILNLFSLINLSPCNSKILDLGSGKGANSIAVAEKFDIRVKEIDAFKPFVDVAIEKSKEKKLDHLTTFICGDIKYLLCKESGYDAVILASVGKIWGDYKTTIKNIREVIKPGGYLIIEEGFLKANAEVQSDLYYSYDELLKQITAFNDEIIHEIIYPEEILTVQNKQYNKWIQERVEELYLLRPDKKQIIKQYVERQIEECNFLEKNFTSALWLIKLID